MNKLGAFFTCYDELEATRFSLHCMRVTYPKMPVYLVYESEINFKYLERELPNVCVSKEEDTLSKCIKIQPSNYLVPENQVALRKCAWSVLTRLCRASTYLNSEYIIMLDPDAVIAGPLNIPDGVALLGSRVNTNVAPLTQLNEVLKRYGGVELTAWGATPAIFNVKKFKEGMQILFDRPQIFVDMCNSFYAMFAHDVLLPSVFSLIGETETVNPDLVECIREPNWHRMGKPLLHQFKAYYPKRNTPYASGDWKQ